MHTRGRPQQWRRVPALAVEDVVPLVLRELEERAEAGVTAGIARERIALDPGFGFGKAHEENYPLLAQLERLHSLGFPLLIGLSRKGFLRHGLAQASRADDAIEDATLAANTAAILGGAHILRVHDVGRTHTAAAIADGIVAAVCPHLADDGAI